MTKRETPNQDVYSPSDNFLAKWAFRFDLWTGVYMLQPWEKLLAYVFVLGGLGLWAYYCNSFIQG
eukprot:CAMPEP_0182461170 /NCGR_PEP_ID=MMETSP1319-20130603/5818_1 /TAXON_ID=172717 /ORGANISM="Bolidomonas pacifica, Strain RCC208" /LENGTH=64 /DNA_ID=CAMNT_0024660401 /DNA_START=229 /DNA_END=419 /DNA_ORIENTATION=+